MTELARLQKLIAHSGITSRRGAEEMIRAGRVTVDGSPAHLGQKVDRESVRVEVDGVPLPIRPGLVYYLLNKPVGVVSTARDPRGRPTVIGLVPPDPPVYPVGRLDADSEGLLVLTNDGDLTNLITHPSYGVTKTYTVLIDGRPTQAQVRSLVEGVDLEDGPAAAISARLIDSSRNRALLEMTMGEGRKREVRRMCEAIGFPVVRLFRIAIGPLTDSDLKSGEWRTLTMEEVRSLYAATTSS
ncbi:MAG: pseudouridine synthase [Acidimicrobiia bacterium]